MLSFIWVDVKLNPLSIFFEADSEDRIQKGDIVLIQEKLSALQ